MNWLIIDNHIMSRSNLIKASAFNLRKSEVVSRHSNFLMLSKTSWLTRLTPIQRNWSWKKTNLDELRACLIILLVLNF